MRTAERDLVNLPEIAAEHHGAVSVRLDQPLDAWPDRGVTLDFGTFAELVAEASTWLVQADVKPGDRVAVAKGNNPDILVFFYACLRVGAVPALLSAALGAESLLTMIRRLDPALLVSDRETLLGPLSRRPARLAAISVDHGVPGCLRPQDLTGSTPPPLTPRPGAGLILHTSGTTGVPKLVQHSLRGFHRAAFFGWRHPSLRYGRLSSSDTVAAVLAWCHVRAVFGFTFALRRGARLAAASSFDETKAVELLASVRPTVLEAHPNVLQYWSGLPGHPSEPLRNVRMFVSTADATHPATVRALLDASHRRRAVFIQAYGMTEVGPVAVRVMTRRVARRMEDARGAGMCVPFHSRARIVSERTGRRLRPGSEGVLQVKTSSLFQTYVGEEERAQEAVRDGWFTTADRGEIGWTGGLRLLDRQVDHLTGITSALRLEEILLERLPDLTEVVLVDIGAGKPTPVVCTAHDRPLKEHDWREQTRDLPPLAEPRLVLLRSLPLTATWKVRRFMLAERLAALGG